MSNRKKQESTGAKVVAKTVAICLAVGLGLGAITGAVINYNDTQQQYRDAAVEFIDYTLRQNNSLYLDENNNDYVLPKYSRETTLTRGKYLAEEIEKRYIYYCEFLDEYYTKDGKPITIIYTFNDNGEVIATRTEVVEDLLEPITVGNNEMVKIVNTKPYSEIANMELIVKMHKYAPIEVNVKGETMYQGDIILKK